MNIGVSLETLASILSRLSEVKRKGWVDAGVSEPVESVAAHTNAVAMLVMSYAPLACDIQKAYCLALVHDIAEATVGDITPFDGVSEQQKHLMELEAVRKMAHETNAPYLLNLYMEYVSDKTVEAQFVHDMDKLQMVMQAADYDKQERAPKELYPEFYKYADSKIKTSIGRFLLNEHRKTWEPQAEKRRQEKAMRYGGVVLLAGKAVELPR